jgi:hypothetical protein
MNSKGEQTKMKRNEEERESTIQNNVSFEGVERMD